MEKYLTDWEWEKELEKNSADPVKLVVFNTREQRKMATACVAMEQHLEKLNGTVAEHQAQILILELNQKNILGRFWGSLKSWQQKIVLVWAFLGLASLPLLGLLATVLTILLTKGE